MSEDLVVYVYNVLFGDAILVEVPVKAPAGAPARARKRFILIDVGNVVASGDAPLLAALQDVHARTEGRVDLYVMTHEHLDHVAGLRHAGVRGVELQLDNVWMTASADPTYGERFPQSKRTLDAMRRAARTFSAALGAAPPAGHLALLHANDPDQTDRGVTYIRERNPSRTFYVRRASKLGGLHSFTTPDLRLRILAPEEDTGVYLGNDAHAHRLGAAGAQPVPPDGGGTVAPGALALPPPGVNGSAFYHLMDRMDRGLLEGLFAIDQAGNNTSLVVELTWRGRRLLFTGDAEQESWQWMLSKARLRPVDFLKLSHHGSSTGMPPERALDLLLPMDPEDRAVAVVSTNVGRFEGVPDAATLDAIRRRVSVLHNTGEVDTASGSPVVPPGAPIEVRLSSSPAQPS